MPDQPPPAPTLAVRLHGTAHKAKTRMRMRLRNLLRVAAVAAMMPAFIPSTASAQSTSKLRDTLTDDQKNVVPDAKILLRNQATGEERSTTSDKLGEYQLAALVPGAYRLEIKAPGFQNRVITDIRI